jgi:redox-sensitive bicupin YhaK (pirin superfamily)
MSSNRQIVTGTAALESPVELTVGPRLRPLGGLEVNRVWPTAKRRLIGPFVFFDHMRRAELAPGQGLDVPPHPHIGLATVTYLFEGALMHADSLGYRQLIRPGELNWMSAGRGITHSERTPPEERGQASAIHGIQSWVALPGSAEQAAPTFVHHPARDLPRIARPGVGMTLIAGSAWGERAPVETPFELFYLDVLAEPGARLTLPDTLGERGIYIVDGEIELGSSVYAAGRMLVLASGDDIELVVRAPTRMMLLGGPPIGEERHIWWNFVSSRPELIEAARADWKAGRFPPVPGDPEKMAMPE